ncbi:MULTISPECIES: Bug family tripartite tricarboxylate transporter substrate binding protein [Ramlibacter]|uniref:Tripartite tricarboxylate transporter substrate binding protein n=1 Tax=Ramlibacter pinisoli TaxID=2682844 RepID=A0A6N8J1Q1_9BURK|nr:MULTISPECIES: tripartite tricarboxylate transporter substrate binding protein [Ramlibacter]MBA2962281.1 tripartite tricarboxylate transporter substrate binding protein [Ramlibacter sp. CGMCC 1.13660]MVQ32223.1 tripartite tricarboxylate transporter substrate binding protein [Ramlibacter pinisoli]
MKRIAGCLLALFLSMGAWAQAEYPNKPIRIVIPFSPGSATDQTTRILGQAVSTALGQPFVYDYKPGANGAIAGAEVAKAAPDGYTLLVAGGSVMAVVPATVKKPPYDPVADFTPITDFGRFTFFLFVNSAVPAKTLGEFVSYAKANPRKLSYGTGNASGIVAFTQMNALAGMDLVHVPYKGEPPAVIDLVAGRLDAMWATPTATLPHAKDGKLRALATSLKTRSALLPDVPTIDEAGMPKFNIVLWQGLVGPAGTPRPVVDRLNREFNAAMKRPEVIAAMDGQAFTLVPGTPEQFGALVKEQIETYRNLLRQAGVQPE